MARGKAKIERPQGFKLLWADCETTGLQPTKRNDAGEEVPHQEITQLSGIIEVNGEVLEEFDIFMRPTRKDVISLEALEVQGKTLKEVMAYPDRREGFDEFMSILDRNVDKYDREDKFVWAGQQIIFDKSFVGEFMREMGNDYFSSYFGRDGLDLKQVAMLMKYKGLFLPKNFKLTTMAETLGLEYQAHDALEDIRMTRKILTHLMTFIHKPVGGVKQLSLL